MNRISLRARLLGGAVFAVGLTAMMPQAASAQCVATLAASSATGAVVCGSTAIGSNASSNSARADERNKEVRDGQNFADGAEINGVDEFNNSGTINQQGDLIFNSGSGASVTFTNGGVWNTTAQTIFSGTEDVLDNAVGATINLTGNATFVGLESFTQSGTLNLGTFVLTGPSQDLVNNGTIITNGDAGLAGFTGLTNGEGAFINLGEGTFTVPAFDVVNDGSIVAIRGDLLITGQTSLTGVGAIGMVDNAADDSLTVDSDYVADTGASLSIDATDNQADLLTIAGAASGTTTVDVNIVVANLSAGNVLIAQTGSTTDNAFVAGMFGGRANPLIAYDIIQSGTDYYLTVAPTVATFQPASVSGNASDFWYQSADEVLSRTTMPNNIDGLSSWGQIYGGEDKVDGDGNATINGVDYVFGGRTKTKRYGFQGGVDYGTAGNDRVGVTLGYAWAKANGALDQKLSGWNVGLYGFLGGNKGIHGSLLAKYDSYKIKLENDVFGGLEPKANSIGIDGEIGYRVGMGRDISVDLKGGFSHVRTKVDDVDAYGFIYDYDNYSSTRGRAGLRALFGGWLSPYAEATVNHEFGSGSNVTLSDDVNSYDLDVEGRGTWVRLEAGVGARTSTRPSFSLWGDLGDRKALGARLGIRFGGTQPYVEPQPFPVKQDRS